jgi:hypothetical protein
MHFNGVVSSDQTGCECGQMRLRFREIVRVLCNNERPADVKTLGKGARGQWINALC